MKKFIVMLLAVLMLLSLVACSDKQGEQEETMAETTEAEAEADASKDQAADADQAEHKDRPGLDQIKIGFVHISDPSDMGYTYNHNLGTLKMKETLGLRDDQIINQFNISEGAECETAIRELAEQGCNIIFATSFGFEDYCIKVAKDFPDIEFCHATGYKAASSGLANMHNYFGKIYEARYLSGIAAGLATKTNKLGYVTAMPFAECISGYDAFYLGAKSVNPDVEMLVMYTMNWNDPTKEAQVAQALIDKGCDVIGQHCDSTAPATTAEANGVFHVGYNSDMRSAAPNASLTSAVWDWSKYLLFAVDKYVKGEEIPVDWSEGLKEGAVGITELSDLVAEGTAEKIEAARKQIVEEGFEVFTGPLNDNTGKQILGDGEVYVEPQSSPTFEHILEGITVFE